MRISRIAYFSLILDCFASLPASSQELKFNTQDFAPFNYEIDGVVSGPAGDIIRRVCAEMKIKCTFDLFPWTCAQAKVRKGQANAMFVISWNEKRAFTGKRYAESGITVSRLVIAGPNPPENPRSGRILTG